MVVDRFGRVPYGGRRERILYKHAMERLQPVDCLGRQAVAVGQSRERGLDIAACGMPSHPG